jgi:hypothetical protein
MQVGVDAYLHGNLALFASLEFDRLEDQLPPPITGIVPTSSSWMWLPAIAGLGGRFGDVRVNLWYRVMPIQDATGWNVRYWYGLGAEVQAVLARRVSLTASIQAESSGATTEAAVTAYFGRNASFRFGLFGGQGELDHINNLLWREAGGRIGFALWLSRRFGFSFQYQAEWYDQVNGGTTDIAHLFTVSAFSRPH